MVNSDSLYDVSVSPPQPKSPMTPRGHSIMDNFVTRTPATERTERSQEATGRLKKPTGRPFAFQPPTANMLQTPSESQPESTKRTDPARARKAKGKRKKYEDYQAEADAEEEARDQRDPDWRGTQETDAAGPARKKQKKSSAPRTPSAFSTPQTGDPVSTTQRKRNSHLSKITASWGDAKDWMPESAWPRPRNKSNVGDHEQSLEDPENWPEPLLERVAQLSGILPGVPERAYRALETATLIDRKGKSRQICTKDIKRIIEGIEISEATGTAPGTPYLDPPIETNEMMPEQPLGYAIAHGGSAAQLPSPRSPTVGREIQIKEGFQPLRAVPHAGSVGSQRHDSPRAQSLEIEAISRSEWEIAQEMEDMRGELRENRLQQKEIRLQQRELRIQRRLRALHGRNQVER